MNQLPRPYFSYSAYALWKRDKDAFRRRYYENEPSLETTETRFGKKYAEESEKMLDPRYTESEFKIEVQKFGTLLHGRLDKFDPVRLKFLDEKTGHADRYGKAPWDKVKVKKLTQLVWYSMLIKEKYGKVDPVCHLIWLETEFEKETRSFARHTLTALGRSNKLRLTGKVKKFSRRIYEWERKKLLLDIKVSIEQIKKDYEDYKSAKGIHATTGKDVTQEVASV